MYRIAYKIIKLQFVGVQYVTAKWTNNAIDVFSIDHLI